MPIRIEGITFDATDPHGAARFWSSALGWDVVDRDEDSAGVSDPTGSAKPFGFQRVPEPKTAKNRMHFDLGVDGSLSEEVERLRALGATRLEEHREAGFAWVVMQDPDGNEFCVGLAVD